MSSTFINPYISEHVPLNWTALTQEFGRAVNYWPQGEEAQAVEIIVIWSEGVEDEEHSPGRYSHALVDNADLASPPALGDAIEKEGSVFDIVRVNAFAYNFAKVILQERI